jgi:hypothetical protein
MMGVRGEGLAKKGSYSLLLMEIYEQDVQIIKKG